MRIGIYTESAGGLGGSEVCVAEAASALSCRGVVEICHHGNIDRARLEVLSGVALRDVRFREIPKRSAAFHGTAGLLSHVTHPLRQNPPIPRYDRTLCFVHDAPPFLVTLRAVAYIHFPLLPVKTAWPLGGESGGRSARRAAVSWVVGAMWRLRTAPYRVVLANSEFTAAWVRRRWGLEARVVYPPIRLDVPPFAGQKAKEIVVLGRFSRSGVSKRQLEFVRAFKSSTLPSQGWRLTCAGFTGFSPADRDYVTALRGEAAGEPVSILEDLHIADVRGVLRRGSVFWHGAGDGIDETACPELVEHFGMSTAEAMAEGCIPVVVARGGQREVVSGLPEWVAQESIEGIVRTTEWLVRHPDVIERTRQRCQALAGRFDAQSFRESIVAGVLGEGAIEETPVASSC